MNLPLFRCPRCCLAHGVELAAVIREEGAITPATEWFFDNFHIVEDVLREVREDLPPGFYRRLPKLARAVLEVRGGGHGHRLIRRPVGVRVGVLLHGSDQAIMADVHRAERWLGLAGLPALAAMLVVGVWRWHRRVGKEGLDEEPAAGHSPPL